MGLLQDGYKSMQRLVGLGAGQHLVNIWSTFGQHLVNICSTFGQHLVNIWATFGQHLVNIWATFCQHLVNYSVKKLSDDWMIYSLIT